MRMHNSNKENIEPNDGNSRKSHKMREKRKGELDFCLLALYLTSLFDGGILCSRIRTKAYLLTEQNPVSRDSFQSFFFPSASLPGELLTCPPQPHGIHFPNPPAPLANLAPLQSSLSTVSNSASLLLFFRSSWPW